MTNIEQIYAQIYKFIPLAISLVGFIAGMVNILKKRAPFFFTMIIFAVGCFTIEQVSLTVNTICGVYNDVWIGLLGVFGCNLFLLSANYETFDKIVDGSELTFLKKLLLFLIPVIIMIFVILIFFIWKDRNMLCAIVFAFIYIPAIPTSYYNVKYLFLADYDINFLKAIKECNIMSLIFIFVSGIYLFIEASGFVPGIVIGTVLHALTVLGLALVAIKGIRQWKN